MIIGVVALLSPLAAGPAAAEESDDGGQCGEMAQDLNNGNIVGTLWNGAQCIGQKAPGALGPLGAVAGATGTVEDKIDGLSDRWKDAIGKFVDALISGNTQALQQVMTLWLHFSIDGSIVDGQASGVTYATWAIAGTLFIISLVVIGTRMAAQRRQGLADGLEDLGMFYGRFLILGVVVPMIIPAALAATDSLTTQILTLLPEGESLSDAIGGTVPDKEVFEPALLLILILFALAGTVTQMVALAARVLMLPVIVGLMPAAAAFGGTEAGKQSTKSMTTWIVAAIAFKPLAALLYVLAFAVSGSESVGLGDDSSALSVIMSLLILGIAGFSPLMLLKVISPALAGVSGQNSAATAGALAGAVGGTAAVALGGAAMGASAMGGGAATGAAGKSASGSSGSPGGNPTPPSSGDGGPSGGDPSGGDGGGGPTGGGAAGGSPAGGQAGGDSSDGRPPSGGPESGGSGAGGAPGQGQKQRSGGGIAGGLRIASRAASRMGGTGASAVSRTGAMIDDIAK